MSGYVSGRTSITSVPADRDNILLNGTNSSSANAGDDLILDASAANTDVGSLIMYEDGSADNERFIDSVNETDKIALVDKVLLNGYASGAGDGDALLFETASGGGFIEFNQISTVSIGGDVQGDVAYNDGYGWTSLPPGTSGQVLKTQGSSANPVWGTAGGATELFHVEKNATQAIATATTTEIVWNVENFDTGGNFDLASDTYVVPADGRYFFYTAIQMSGVTADARVMMFLYVDGTAKVENELQGTATHTSVWCEFLANLSAGAEVTAAVRHHHGSDRDTSSDPAKCQFGGWRLD